jgi:NADH-quinone oxidoreductase subunit L
MPTTALTFWIGSLSLAGIPVFAGFFSKDEIASTAWGRAVAEPWYWGAFAVLEIAAFLTAFYIARACFLTFSGQPRSHAATHAHESPSVMTAPLVVLAFFVCVLGWLGTPLVAGNLFEQFLRSAGPAGVAEAAAHFNWLAAGISVLIGVAGILLSASIYRWQIVPVNVLKYPLYPVYWAAKHKFFFDEIYQYTAVAGTLIASRLCKLIDVYVIDMAVNAVGWVVAYVVTFAVRVMDTYFVDGAVNLTGWVTGQAGKALTKLQTGRVQEYMGSAVFLGAAIALALLLVGLFIR